MPNQLKADPTRTTTLRNRYVADMRRRFKSISTALTELIVADDAFGLDESKPFIINQQVGRQAWRFQTNSQKVASYRKWLQQQVDAKVLTQIGGIEGKPWTAQYLEQSYTKGVIRSYTDVHAETLAGSPDFYQGGKSQFLRDAFNAPVTQEKLRFLSTRSYEELKGISDVMSQQMSRIIADGFVRGVGPAGIARALRENVAGITKQRAIVLARTEVIAAHAEGQLDSLERLGVEEVGIQVEWSTAGDDRVCELCAPLEGVVMTIEEARGLIPRHAQCRCAWIPADPKHKEAGQLWDKEGKKGITDSIQAEKPKASLDTARKKSVWVGKELPPGTTSRPTLEKISKAKVTPKPKGRDAPFPSSELKKP